MNSIRDDMGLKLTHFLVQIEGVQVLQGHSHHFRRDVPINKGQAPPRFQVSVGLRFVVIIVITVTAVRSGLNRLLLLLLSDTLLDVVQSLLGELLEAIGAWRCEQRRSHIVILQQSPLYLEASQDSQLWEKEERGRYSDRCRKGTMRKEKEQKLKFKRR